VTSGRRLVVHLSDLHFGREDPAVVAALSQELVRLAPDLIAVSGDLTQRARRHQFKRARRFLDALPFPRLVVPGNHDVPLFNVVARMLNPLGGYRKYITADLQPVFADPLLTVVGTDTTMPSTVKEGRIPDDELARVCRLVSSAGPDVVKIFVGHHPFGAPDEPGNDPASETSLGALTRAGVDAFLTGHLHVSYTGHTAHRYNAGGRSAIVVEAGTATSTRLREDANAFNVLHVEPGTIVVERHDWQGRAFAVADTQRFQKTAAGWAS
jgi:3',5'-cyclic AMP phosphodiesterase CpdA